MNARKSGSARASDKSTNGMAVYGMVWYCVKMNGITAWYGMAGYSRVWRGIVWYENSMVGYGAPGHQTNQGVMA